MANPPPFWAVYYKTYQDDDPDAPSSPNRVTLELKATSSRRTVLGEARRRGRSLQGYELRNITHHRKATIVWDEEDGWGPEADDLIPR